jgi:hypothetical protein
VSITDKLLENNATTRGPSPRYLPMPPVKRVPALARMDARLSVDEILGPPDDARGIRNADWHLAIQRKEETHEPCGGVRPRGEAARLCPS